MSGETGSSGWMVKLELSYRELDMSFRAFLVTRVLPIFFLGLFTIIVFWWTFPDIISGYLFAILMFVPVYLATVVLFWPYIEFEHKGLALIEADKVTEDQLMEVALEAGADDVVEADGAWEVTCPPTELHTLKEALVAAEIEPDSAAITWLPQAPVACDDSTAEKILRLIDAFEDHDDVQKVYHNAEISDAVMEKYA